MKQVDSIISFFHADPEEAIKTGIKVRNFLEAFYPDYKFEVLEYSTDAKGRVLQQVIVMAEHKDPEILYSIRSFVASFTQSYTP